MKNKSLFLDFDETEDVSVVLVRLKREQPFHELFFKINRLNSFKFFRKNDLEIEDYFGYYNFPIFEAFDRHTQVTFRIIINHSYDFRRKEKPIEGLFDLLEEEKYFIHPGINLILFSKEGNCDFSVINLPKELVSSVEEYKLYSEEKLYETILNYDE